MFSRNFHCHPHAWPPFTILIAYSNSSSGRLQGFFPDLKDGFKVFTLQSFSLQEFTRVQFPPTASTALTLQRFPNLAPVAIGYLLSPRSAGQAERTFSLLGHIVGGSVTTKSRTNGFCCHRATHWASKLMTASTCSTPLCKL